MKREARSSYAPWMYDGRNLMAALPQYRIPTYRWNFRALAKLDPFTHSQRYSRRGQSFPESSNAVFTSGETKNDQASIHPGSFLVAIAGSSDQSESFRFSLADSLNDRQLFDGFIEAASGAGTPGVPFSQPSPFLPDGLVIPFPYGAQVVVGITNLATVDAIIQLVLYFAEPQVQIIAPGRGVVGAEV